MDDIIYTYFNADSSRGSTDNEHLCDVIERNTDNIIQSVTQKLDVQTKLLKEIKEVHPIERQAHTKLGKFLQKITKIEVMAVIIAALQLIIAFPQLKIAYESFANDETANLKNVVNDFVTHTEEIAIIHIPDSLMTPQIREFRLIQSELFFNLKLLSHTQISSDIKGEKVDEIRAAMSDNLIRLLIIGNCCQRINEIEQRIYLNYFPSDKITTTNTTGIDINNLTEIQQIFLLYAPYNKFWEINSIQKTINTKLQNYYNYLSSKKSVKGVNEIKGLFKRSIPIREYAEYIKLQDELGIAFINALNQIQYSLAYDIQM